MKLPSKWVLAAFAGALGVALGLTLGTGDAQQKNQLTAKKIAAAPSLDGAMDASWQGAAPMTVKVVGGRGLQNGSTEVSIRAV